MLIFSAHMPDLPIIREAVEKAPFAAGRFLRQEMERGGKRIKRLFMKERSQSPDGIKLKKNTFFSKVSPVGTAPMELQLRIGSNVPFMQIHETGGVITPKSGKFLIFRGRTGKFRFTKTRRVVLKPRLKFFETITRIAADPNVLQNRLEKAAMRAIKAAMKGSI